VPVTFRASSPRSYASGGADVVRVDVPVKRYALLDEREHRVDLDVNRPLRDIPVVVIGVERNTRVNQKVTRPIETR
jgi:hypothetical protein